MTVWYVEVNGAIFQEYFSKKEATLVAQVLRKKYPGAKITVSRD